MLLLETKLVHMSSKGFFILKILYYLRDYICVLQGVMKVTHLTVFSPFLII